MYTDFAYVYDRLMYDIDYSKWADYVEGIFRRNGLKPSLILDLGCGTGNFCMKMARRGYDMIGIDISTDMLSCAKTKSAAEGLDILFLNQDMTGFELYGTVDAVVCLMDSVNYVTDKRMVQRLFKLVNNYLNPRGLFIFDVNTPYKFEKVLSSNMFYDIGSDITYIWENSYDKRKRICEFDLTFFISNDGELFRKYEETHLERAYTVDELKRFINNSNLALQKIYDNLAFSTIKEDSERIFFVCKKE